MKWKHWLHGLVAAIVGGSATGAALLLADYERIMEPGGFVVLGKVVLILALTHLAMYLKQSPLPPEEGQ